MNPEYQSRSHSRWALPVGFVLAASLMAGCDSNGGAQEEPIFQGDEIAGQVSPTDAVSQSIFAIDQVRDSLSGYAPDTDKARVLVLALPAGSIVRGALEHAADLATADDTITRSASSYKPLSTAEATARALTIEDPTIEADVLSHVQAQAVDTVVRKFDTTYQPITEAEADSQLAALPDSPQRAAALSLLTTTKAEDILDRIGNDYVDEPLTPAEARIEATTLGDSAIAAMVQQQIDPAVAGDILTDVILHKFTPDQAAAAARTEIIDPVVQSDVAQAAELYKDTSNYYDFRDIQRKYDPTLRDKSPLDELIKANETVIHDIDSAAYKAATGYSNAVYENLKIADNTIDDTIKTHNAITPAEMVAGLPPLAHPELPLNLSDIKGSKLVPDWYQQMTGNETAAPLNQFAEIYAESGKLALHFQENDGLDAAAKGMIQEAALRADPLLQAAFASGDLLSVRFVKDTQFDPYYYSGSREVVMVLPEDDSTSVDQLNSALIHETIHALARDIKITGEGLTTEQAHNIDTACASLRAISYDSVESMLRVYPELVQNASAIARAEDKPVLDQFTAEIQAGTLDSVMSEYLESDTQTMFNNCSDAGLGDVLNVVGKKVGVEDAYKKLDYLYDTEPGKALSLKWHDVMAYSSIFKKLNESQFVTTDYIYKESLGHSQDNTDELIASLADAAASFPVQLKAAMDKMTDTEKAATVSAMAATFDIIRSQHPTLANYFNQLQAQITG